jgi:hypothetical protein
MLIDPPESFAEHAATTHAAAMIETEFRKPAIRRAEIRSAKICRTAEPRAPTKRLHMIGQ